MSLFTSNFRRESRVLAVVLAVVLGSELLVRTFRPLLSADITHVRQIPAIARAMSEKTGLRVLFLGNSLTRRGVNLTIVRGEMESREERAAWFDKVVPDDTAILDWYYLFKKYFKGASAPDYVVLGWVENQLDDTSVVHPDRIAAYYGGWHTAGEMFSNDLHGVAPRIDYVLSTVSAMYSEKERIRTRLLALAVPDYRTTAGRFNAMVVNTNKTPALPPTCRRLERFLELCARRHVKVIVAAMPLPQAYPIEDGLRRVVQERGALLLDLRKVDGISNADYADGYHLAPGGAATYSHELGRELAGAMQKPSGQVANALQQIR